MNEEAPSSLVKIVTLPRRATLDDMASVATIHRLAFFHAMPHMPELHTDDERVVFYRTAVFSN